MSLEDRVMTYHAPPSPPTGEAPLTGGATPAGYPGAPFGSHPGPGGSWFNLYRPRQGRKVAGVCGAIGHATNTDPVLWRVLTAVLVVFGGVGLLVYALGWLLIPEEGDTASPLAALLGRGRSSTASGATILLILLVIMIAGVVLNDSTRNILLISGIAGLVYLIARRPVESPPSVPTPMPSPADDLSYRPPFAPHGPFAGASGGSSPTPSSTPDVSVSPPVAVSEASPTPPAPAAPSPTGGADQEVTVKVPLDQPSPLAKASEVTQPLSTDATATPGSRPAADDGTRLLELAEQYRMGAHLQSALTEPLPLSSASPAPDTTAKPARSILGRITIFTTLIALGFLALIDGAGTPVPAAAYLACALAVIGVGLLVGTWFGRARGLIILGMVLTLALPATVISSRVQFQIDGDLWWSPTSVSELQDEYSISLGYGVLDLSGVDFTDQTAQIRAEVFFGNLEIIVPPDVRIGVTYDVNMGNALVLGQTFSGFDDSETTVYVTDTGVGTLILDIDVNGGNLEVHR